MEIETECVFLVKVHNILYFLHRTNSKLGGGGHMMILGQHVRNSFTVLGTPIYT